MDMEPLSTESTHAKAQPNVWMVPVAYISHVRCFLQFAQQLARHGVIVTFFCTEEDAERLGLQDTTTLECWRREGVDIRPKLVKFQGLDLAGETGPDPWVNSLYGLEDIFEVILKQELEVGVAKPTCVISDYWLAGIYERAKKYNVPVWVLSSFSAGNTVASVYISRLESKGILKLPPSRVDKDSQETLISIPGLPLLPISEIEATAFRSNPFYNVGRRNGSTLEKTEILILSSFEGLETRALPELRRLLENAAKNEKREATKVYTVGPTFPIISKGSRSTENGVSEEERHPCFKFLDKQPDSSVLLVAFGNDVNHTPKQIHEIAHGLEDSLQPFLCALHTPAATPQFPTGDIFDAISPDCITRTKDRGMFVQGWVPQMEILRHPAIGGFLSHCGQNSFLESVCMGIPLLTWPANHDQMMNARSIVDAIQVGLEISRGLDIQDLVDRKEVETKVRALFQSEQGVTVRKNAQRLREVALQAAGENGSSYKNIEAIVTRIRGLAA